MVGLLLEEVTKRYPGGAAAVDALSLEVRGGEVCVLVGPSGCGKTTTLKMINRLIEPTAGRILLGGDDVLAMPVTELRRRMGYVIQQVGLFPHQRIFDNVATVPRLLGWEKKRIRSRVEELLDLVGLDAATYARRFPRELSGGQRQRVGVARALAADPPVLLMDEPFGAIDPVTRDRLQGEFLRLQGEVHKTVVFVTHDIEEAVRLGDRIAILTEGGRLEQYAPPAEILGHPASPFVADFIGADRGLKRLAVTTIDTTDLERPTEVAPGDGIAKARLRLEAAGEQWAVVLDRERRVHGYLDRSEATGDCRVGDRARPLPASVPVGAPLKQALSELLTQDLPWIPVVDGGRYLGVLSPDALHGALRRSVAGGSASEDSGGAEHTG